MAIRWLLIPVVAGACLAAVPSAPHPAHANVSFAPATLSTSPFSVESISELAVNDPVTMLAGCRKLTQESARNYTAQLVKQERVNGVLNPPEETRIAVREEPYAILMIWTLGARRVGLGSIEGSLYAAGQNDGKLTVWRPGAILKTVDVSPNDVSARSASRYSITEAGLFHTIDRTYRAWFQAQHHGRLHVDYLGLKSIEELNGRKCHVLHRKVEPAEVDSFTAGEKAIEIGSRKADAFSSITIMIDAETGWQIGAELRRADGEWIGRYYFRDVKVVREFDRSQFTPAAFRK